MSAREDERVRGILRDAVSAMVNEEIVAIAWFHRPGGVGDSWRKGPSLLRRVLAPRGDHPEDRLGNRNVIVLTPTRVVAIAGTARAPLVRARGIVVEWPRGEVRFAKGARTASSLMNAIANTYQRRLTQVTLTGAGGVRLVLELERDGVARAVVEALGQSLAPA